MAMAAGTIVAENLTLTGSIGVVTGEPKNASRKGGKKKVNFRDITLVGILIEEIFVNYRLIAVRNLHMCAEGIG